MGKTGTSSDFRDALFVGSTYGADGVTVAVRIGYDDNRELGEKETGGRAALPIFRDVVQGIYTQGLTGTTPSFPEEMERRITDYVAWAAGEETEAWAAGETAPVFEPAVLPARLMPALALAPAVTAPGPMFDPARSDRHSKRDRPSSMPDR
jgi:membrane carboxypeptidase/penicillin-binding protein